MLRATRRLLRPGGRTAFTVIHDRPGLSPAQRRRASRAGPSATVVRTSYPSLLERAGFVDIDEVDVSEVFLGTTRGWNEGWDAHAADVFPEHRAGFEERQGERRRSLAAIEEGILMRSLLSARRPIR